MKINRYLCVIMSAMLVLAGCSGRQEVFSSSEPESSAPPIVIQPAEPSEVEEEPIIIDRPALSMTADFLKLSELPNEGVTWGPGTHKDELGRSTACEGLQAEYGDRFGAYFIGPEDEKTVTISFDQGYENGYTSVILDTLKEKNVQAIFFLTGHYVRSQPELVQRMIDEGHILGNHSDAHKVYCIDITAEESREDALYMQQKLRDDFDYEMRLFRFPEGEFSEQSLALMQEMGYTSVFWSFAYADWDPNNQPEPDAAYEKILSFVHPGEIMLLHSVSSTNAEILGDVIDGIRDMGYEVGVLEGLK